MINQIDTIIEIGIDETERLFVRPSLRGYEQIYRAAMEVYWDRTAHFLYSPSPRLWTYDSWYSQIVRAASSEYGRDLKIDDATAWTNIPFDLKNAILELHRNTQK